MAKIVLTILFYSLLFAIEFIEVYQSKDKKKLIVFSALFIIAFIISLLTSIGVRIPSPAIAFKKLLFD